MRQVNEIFSVILSREMNQLEVHFDRKEALSEKLRILRFRKSLVKRCTWTRDCP